MQDVDPSWDGLLSWLQTMDHRMKDNLLVYSKRTPGSGRGLFVASDIPPNTPLFTVPEPAHMNAKTLSPLYGLPLVSELTATQLISMHLFLHRPGQGESEDSTDPNFGPYISILPKSFEGHPLSWWLNYSQDELSDTKFLVDCSPPGVKRALRAMADRFSEDWRVVSRFLNSHPHIVYSTLRPPLRSSSFVSKEYVDAYLWAWLNVNTRCVYHRLCSTTSSPDNLTLCPLLDLANHTSLPEYASPTNPIPTFFSPSSHALKKGDEVYLRYGSHPNITLFTEYGFVEQDSPNGGRADVQDILESLIHEKGNLGEWIKTTLESTNYWGDWTLHDAPLPAHPSYRLLPALRLMQLSPPLSRVLESKDPFSEFLELQAWQETILGERDIVSSENERAVWQQLLEICSLTAARAEEGLDRLQRQCIGMNMDGWRKQAVEAIRTLWLEDKRVSAAVMQSIRSGEAID